MKRSDRCPVAQIVSGHSWAAGLHVLTGTGLRVDPRLPWSSRIRIYTGQPIASFDSTGPMGPETGAVELTTALQVQHRCRKA